MTNEEFISEVIQPIAGTGQRAGATRGEPAIPMRFIWRGQEYAVTAVLKSWKTHGPCKHGSGEKYLRKHWYRIRTEPAEEMTIYFERQPRRGSSSARHWVIYTRLNTSQPS